MLSFNIEMASVVKKKIGIDLGTSNTRVYTKGEGLVYNEPTIVVVDINKKEVVAIGNAAHDILGKTPAHLEVRKPIHEGVVSSRKAAIALVKFLLDNIGGSFRVLKPDVFIAVPSAITSVERRAIMQVCLEAGAGAVKLYPSVLLAAIGAELQIHKSYGNMMVVSGGGTTEMAVMSMNGIVVADSIRVAGEAINDSLASFIRKQFAMLVGEATLEEIKTTVCSAVPVENPKSIEISGRDTTNGLPRTIKLDTNDLVDAIKPPLTQIVLAIKKVLEKTPPELSSDIADSGVVMSGGNSQLWNIEVLLTKAVGVPFFVAEDPVLAVVRGLEKVLGGYDVELVER